MLENNCKINIKSHIYKGMILLKTINITYFLLVFLCTFIITVISSMSYFYFKNEFMDSVAQKEISELKNTADVVENELISKLQKICFELSQNFHDRYFLEYPLYNPQSKLKDIEDFGIHETLSRYVAANIDIFEEIMIYYPDNDFLISSKFGAMPLDEEGFQAYSLRSEIQSIGLSRTKWVFLQNLNKVAYISLYPWIYGPYDKEAYMIIYLQKNAISKLIKNYMGTDTYIVTSDGIVVYSTNTDLISTRLPYYDKLKDKIDSHNAAYNATISIKNVKNIALTTYLKGSDWNIVKTVSMSGYYAEADKIWKVIVSISLATLVIGFVLAFVISNKIEVFYQKHKIEKLKPVIKNTFVMHLINGSIKNSNDLTEYENLLNFDFSHKYFQIIVVLTGNAKGLSLEEQQICKYSTMDFINSHSDNTRTVLSVAVDENKICIVHNTDQPEHEFAKLLASKIDSDYCKTISAGNFTSNILELNALYRESANALKHNFFAMRSFITPEILAQSSRETLIEYEERLVPAIIAKADDIIDEIITEFNRACKSGLYSYEGCIKTVRRLCGALLAVGNGLGFPEFGDYEQAFADPVANNENIDTLCCRLSIFCHSLIEFSRAASAGHNEVILDVKKYIDENISSDLSLNNIADQVHFSPKYISKIFKDETGDNLSGYINTVRLIKAASLLSETDLSIEKVSAAVGFSSSQYFIRKFKEKYFMTPKEYKVSLLRSHS